MTTKDLKDDIIMCCENIIASVKETEDTEALSLDLVSYHYRMGQVINILPQKWSMAGKGQLVPIGGAR